MTQSTNPNLVKLAIQNKEINAYTAGYMRGRRAEREKGERRRAQNTFPESLQRVDWKGVIQATALLCVLMIAPILAAAQTTLTITGPATVTAGNTETITISLAGTSGTSFAALQMALSLPTGATYGTPALAAAWSVATGATLQCYSGTVVTGGTPNMCIAVSDSLTAMSDGAVGTVPITIPTSVPPGSFTMTLGNMLGASTAATAIPLTSGTPYTVQILSRCDINGDGAFTVADAQAMINEALGKAACSVSGVSCNVVTVEMVQLAVLGQGCRL